VEESGPPLGPGDMELAQTTLNQIATIIHCTENIIPDQGMMPEERHLGPPKERGRCLRDGGTWNDMTKTCTKNKM
jgi:hypothetical protein